MRLLIPVLVLGLGVVALPGGAQEESLAEIARREQERRAKVEGSERVITDADLGNAGVSAPPAGSEASSSTQATAEDKAGAAKEKSPEEQRAEARAKIQKEIDYQAEVIRNARKQADEIQAQLNNLSTYALGQGRASLIEVLEQRQKDIAAAEQRITDLEEEARRAGVSVSRP